MNAAEAAPPLLCVLHCPRCHFRHLDEGVWRTRLHRRHECMACHFRWIVEPFCAGASDDELGVVRGIEPTGVLCCGDPEKVAAKLTAKLTEARKMRGGPDDAA